MNYKSIILSLSLLLFSVAVFAQEKKGNLEIVKSPMIDLLQERRVYFENNPVEVRPVDKENGTRSTVLGFRVQIYSGSSRNEAYATQARFQKQYKDIATYVSYTQPNYRVKVGDFRSRSEAQAFMREVKNDYPMVFLFTEQVYVYY
ncbi:SPOR domain-containing protein [Albibacterium profundi]|uniref:SPOR domain-containing protein n=1 Tax=Albibacterium profundi TaxID=3134906 RepID=A0ABV5CD12_9SPHI